MSCGTVQGLAALTSKFGVGADEASLVTSTVRHVKTSDKKEAKDHCGNVVAVAFYNKRSEVTVEGLGTSALDIGATLSLSSSNLGTIVGTLFVDQVSIEQTNEDFIKTTITATAYDNIPSS